MTGTSANSKTYMIPLSSLQYKRWPDASQHYYRIGEVNLPQRMTEILSLGKPTNPGTVAPDFVEVITWNDAGESHYIGNIWDESVASWEYLFGNSTSWSHAGWQPIISSFIAAFKGGKDASGMLPPQGSPGVGAMWYRTILKSATCSSDPLGKPQGWEGAQDAVNWAVVLAPGSSGVTVRVTSGGKVIQTVSGLGAGLQYSSAPGMIQGEQVVQVLDASGSLVLSAHSTIDVLPEANGICNYNYQVSPLQ